MPNYSNTPSQPFTGRLPGPIAFGPRDLRPSSSTVPSVQARLQQHYGRQLAGVDGMRVVDEAMIPATARNELELLAEGDDVQGDGIFDQSATEPNIYPDAGVFASRANLPGYLARERFYQPSEVVDATTGRPVTYVPAGANSMDSAAQIAFIERGAYQPPRPVIQAQQDAPMPYEGTVNESVGRGRIGRSGAEFAMAGVQSTEMTAGYAALTAMMFLGLGYVAAMAVKGQ